MNRTGFALPILLLLPSLAPAGLIPWSYKTEVSYTDNYGHDFRLNVPNGGSFAQDPTDFNSIGLFTVDGISVRPSVRGQWSVQYSFGLRVTLTDSVSNESAAFHYTGGYQSIWNTWSEDPNDWDWVSEHSSFGDYHGRAAVQLGRNVYTVRAYGGGPGDSNIWNVMEVEVVPLGVPEPGTLGLAGVGLASAAGWLIRRRKRG